MNIAKYINHTNLKPTATSADIIKLRDEAQRQDWYSGGLLDKYFPCPTQEVTDEGWHNFYSEWGGLCVKLDEEAEKSPLPESFDGVDLCTRMLQKLRLMDLERCG